MGICYQRQQQNKRTQRGSLVSRRREGRATVRLTAANSSASCRLRQRILENKCAELLQAYESVFGSEIQWVLIQILAHRIYSAWFLSDAGQTSRNPTCIWGAAGDCTESIGRAGAAHTSCGGTLLPSITGSSWLGLLPPLPGLSGYVCYLEIVCSPLHAWGEWWEGALQEFCCCIASFSGVSMFQNLSTGQKQRLKSSKWLFVGQTCCIQRSGLTYFPLGGSDL